MKHGSQYELTYFVAIVIVKAIASKGQAVKIVLVSSLAETKYHSQINGGVIIIVRKAIAAPYRSYQANFGEFQVEFDVKVDAAQSFRNFPIIDDSLI